MNPFNRPFPYITYQEILHVFQLGDGSSYIVYEFINRDSYTHSDTTKYVNIKPAERDSVFNSFFEKLSDWEIECYDKYKEKTLKESNPDLFNHLHDIGKTDIHNPVNLSEDIKKLQPESHLLLNERIFRSKLLELDQLQKIPIKVVQLLESIQIKINGEQIEQGNLVGIDEDQLHLYFILQYLIKAIPDPRFKVQLCIYTLKGRVENARVSLFNVFAEMEKTHILRNHLVMIYPLPLPLPLAKADKAHEAPLLQLQRETSERQLLQLLRQSNYAKENIDKRAKAEYKHYWGTMEKRGFGNFARHEDPPKTFDRGPVLEENPARWRKGLSTLGSAVSGFGSGVRSGLGSVATRVRSSASGAALSLVPGRIVQAYHRRFNGTNGRATSPGRGGKSKRVRRVKRSSRVKSSTKRRK